MRSLTKLLLAVLVSLLAFNPTVLAQSAKDIPLKNWTVPPLHAGALGGSGIQPFTHTQSDTPAVFVPFGPCRLTDSRVSSGGPGPIGGSGSGGERVYDFVITGCPAIAGLQAAQDVSSPILAWSLNFTVVNTLGPGFLYAYPTGGTPPPVATLNYTGAPGELRNNAAIVPVNPATGAFTVGTGVNGTDVIIDANGVFLNALEPNTSLRIISEVDDAAIIGENTSTALNAQGVRGLITSTSPGGFSTAVRGQNNGTGGFGIGVWGSQAGTGWGVRGTAAGGLGVFGTSTGAIDGANGVLGQATGATGVIYGVRGLSDSSSSLSAGVFGLGDVSPPGANVLGGKAGVRGVSDGFGVLGISDASAVAGLLLNAAGSIIARGDLGRVGGDSVNCGGVAEPACPPQWGVFSSIGSIGSTATKFFVDPHPTDPSKVIGYISLEGPEAGTYFRGRGRFENGIAKITVPEHFRLVTDPEGLTVQITPIGGMASVGVLRVDLNEIVVQSSRNLEFSYLVQGVRSTFKNTQPVWQGPEFRPESAEDRLPAGLSEGQKARLIANGTYKADGTVNMETAQRLGWDKVWEKRSAPVREPAPE